VSVTDKIQDLLREIRPLILTDGGDIELVSFEQGIVSVRLLGACITCPLSIYTLKFGIEERLKEQIPEVREVKAVV